MGIKTYSLTTSQRVADFAGLGTLTGTKLTIMDRLVDQVTEVIEKYLGYRVQETTYTNEEYDTEVAEILLLKNFPVSTTATFALHRRTSALNEDDWDTIDSQYYHIDYASGIIQTANGIQFAHTKKGYRVTYTAGFDFDNSATFLSDTAGGDIELAAWMMIAPLWDRRRGGFGIESEAIGDYRVKYRRTIFENEEVKNLLDKYARQDEFGVITPYQG